MRHAGQSSVEPVGTARRTNPALRAAGMLTLAALLNTPVVALGWPGPELVPGVMIDYSPASTCAYVGSPSIAVLPNGAYVASHDFFGPGTSNDTTAVFRSTDRGASWNKVAEVQGQWWSTLFIPS